MMLVDRDREIVALSALFRDCAQGKGIVAVIRGPVASGKTTLLQAFAEQAVAGGAIFLGAIASRAERSLPLSILDQLFRGSLLPATIASQIAELMEGRILIGMPKEPEPEVVSPNLARVFEGLLKLLVELSEGQPVVIAVDDMQYSDVASLQCLSYLVRRVGTSRILTVLTECTQTLPADRLLRAEILRQGNCHCIPLAPLSPSSVASLLGRHLDSEAAQHLASACHAMTGGNPFLVNALGEDSCVPADGSPARLLPSGAFSSAIVTCLHRYEPKMVELAQAVAVLAESATPCLLGELLEISPVSATAGIDALSASGLLESGHFRHEVARQAVLDHMTDDERAAMHGRAARMLYRTGAAPAILAGHIVAAGRLGVRWTVPVLKEAAEGAVADGETKRAIGYLMRAASECVDEGQSATIRFALACTEWPIDPECAARHLSELVTDAREGRLDSECMGKLAYYLLWLGDIRNATEILAALDIVRKDATSEEAGFQDRHMTIRSPLDFLYPDVARRARHAGTGTPSVLENDGEVTVVMAERILQGRGLNDPALASVTSALMALICEDMLDRAAFWCKVMLQEPEASRGSPLRRAVLTGFWAMIETRWGNLPAAETHARSALALLTEKAWGVGIGGPLSSLLLTTTASRKHEDAAAYLRMQVPEAMFGTPYGLLYLYGRGEYYLATGRAQAALADFQDCGYRMIAWGLDLPSLVPWRTKAAEACLVMGNSRKARELSTEQLALVGSGSTRTRGITLRALALTSHPRRRTGLLRESAELLRDSGARLELAYTFTELSNAHLALGEGGRAHWAARQARNLAERCGAQALRNTISIKTTDLDQREPGNGVDTRLLTQLSDAERRVAMLAAYGYTNGQIANKLYITVSTVEQHLTRAYRKLGVTGRAELPIDI
jgi:DNA-binding CsgD family transcriptional regulator